jgi:hypothetical protein
MEQDDEKVLAAFEKHDEFVRVQNELLSCDLADEPSAEENTAEFVKLKNLKDIVGFMPTKKFGLTSTVMTCNVLDG